MARLAEKVVYRFEELEEDAKEKAREWYRNGTTDYEWYDTVFDEAKEIGRLMGIEISNIFFSGFYSQGDGACFEGSYAYAKGSVKKIKEYAPKDEKLHRIALALQKEQRKEFYEIEAKVKHRGHYQHEGCTEISVWNGYSDVQAKTEEAIKEALRDYMCWIYRTLEREYEWLNSDEQVDEAIIVNEYEFEEDGRIA